MNRRTVWAKNSLDDITSYLYCKSWTISKLRLSTEIRLIYSSI